MCFYPQYQFNTNDFNNENVKDELFLKFNFCYHPFVFCTSQSTVTKETIIRSLHSSQTILSCFLWFGVSVQFSSVAQSCPTLCDPMNCRTPGLPVHHQLPEFTQTQVHRVSDAIQPSHPLSSPSPPAPNPSQHQSLFQ